jgi:hypothetical protein
MGKQATSVDSQVLARIRQQGPGSVFTPTDFADLGPRNALDLALSRNARRNHSQTRPWCLRSATS